MDFLSDDGDPQPGRPGDYTVLRFLQEGVMGKVFSGKRKRDRREVAMKFFGYTRQEPKTESVLSEIKMMRAVLGIEGAIQLIDVFEDTVRGMVVGRRSVAPFPVIVMELMAGSDLFDRINTRSAVSERDLSQLFKSIVLAVDSLHSRRLIHRDLKPENLMLCEPRDDSPIKIIDFGMMVALPAGQDVLVEEAVRGTPGYFAPESLSHPNQYSTRSDMWQLGCILYAMLSGLTPFGSKGLDRIKTGQYEPMEGYGWDNISPPAKDLVSSLLKVNQTDRLSVLGVLQHPWISSKDTSDQCLGDDYKVRLKHLSLKQKLKKFFAESDIIRSNRLRRQKLEEVVPLLNESNYDRYFAGTTEEFYAKLCHLKRLVLGSIRCCESGSGGEAEEPVLKKMKSMEFGHLTFDTFSSAMIEAELPELACQKVFGIFDLDGSGAIDLKEFLLTMIAFRPCNDDDRNTEESIRSSAQLYFKVFDLNDNGFIDLSEMKAVVGCFFQDDVDLKISIPAEVKSPSTGQITNNETSVTLLNKDIDSVACLFDEFDKSKDGQIDLDEFVGLYEALLRMNSSRKSNMSLC